MKFRIPAAMVAVAFVLVSEVNAQGWFQKSTGIKTPDPIRKIAPNGVRLPAAPSRGDNGSYLQVITEYWKIAPNNGEIVHYFASSTRSEPAPRRTGTFASVHHNQRGEAFYTYTKATPSQIRAPHLDRPQQKLQYDQQMAAQQQLAAQQQQAFQQQQAIQRQQQAIEQQRQSQYQQQQQWARENPGAVIGLTIADAVLREIQRNQQMNNNNHNRQRHTSGYRNGNKWNNR